jgi:hypothetical protein
MDLKKTVEGPIFFFPKKLIKISKNATISIDIGHN